MSVGDFGIQQGVLGQPLGAMLGGGMPFDKSQPRCSECGQMLCYLGTFKGKPIYGHRRLDECGEFTTT